MPDHPPPPAKDPAEEILDELLDGLAEFFPGAMREEARDFVLDAVAADPVTELLVERIRERRAPDRSGEAPIDGESDAADKDKASGGES